MANRQSALAQIPESVHDARDERAGVLDARHGLEDGTANVAGKQMLAVPLAKADRIGPGQVLAVLSQGSVESERSARAP